MLLDSNSYSSSYYRSPPSKATLPMSGTSDKLNTFTDRHRTIQAARVPKECHVGPVRKCGSLRGRQTKQAADLGTGYATSSRSGCQDNGLSSGDAVPVVTHRTCSAHSMQVQVAEDDFQGIRWKPQDGTCTGAYSRHATSALRSHAQPLSPRRQLPCWRPRI